MTRDRAFRQLDGAGGATTAHRARTLSGPVRLAVRPGNRLHGLPCHGLPYVVDDRDPAAAGWAVVAGDGVALLSGACLRGRCARDDGSARSCDTSPDEDPDRRDGGHDRVGGDDRKRQCVDDFFTGQWEEGQRLADEGLAVCEEHGYRFFAWYFLYIQAILAAARGDHEVSRALADRITRWAVPRGVHGAELRARHPLVLSAIGRGDFEDAYRHATAVSPAGTLAAHVPHALWVTFDLVEAAVRTGRQAAADAHVTAMTDAGIAAISLRMALLQDGAAAIAASQSRATALFERAADG